MRLLNAITIKIVIQILLYIQYVINDCGLPAIPFNAQIDKVQQIYYEGSSINYQCQLEDLKLIGNSSRKCENSRWIGTIPRCVEELNYGTIKMIEIADTKNHSLEYRRNWSNRDSTAAYYIDYKHGQCLRSSKMSRPHTWLLHLIKPKRHISYVEIEILDKNKNIINNDISKIIKSSKINDLRECVANVLSKTEITLRLSLTCFMEFESESKFEAWEKDQTQAITIDFDVDDISICEIRLYTNSFMPFHRCGSADIVLHSTMEFVKSGNKYSGNSYYRYRCDDGFQLEGNEDVRCGLNNEWLDIFPVCKPKALCPFPPSKEQTISVGIKFEHLFSFEGNISAVVGSVVSYSCVDHKNNSIMIGDSVRVCGTDSKWSGIDPNCIHDYDLNSDYYNQLKETEVYDKQMTTFQTFFQIVSTFNQTSLACGIPAMPLFAKPTTSLKYRLFGAQADLRLWYENGTVINYSCESAYRWVTGDVAKRTCVNGKWTGRVGKCAVNWGNKISLQSVYTYDLDKDGKWLDQHYVQDTNSTSNWDEHFAYNREADKGECATFTVEARHKWSLYLNQSTTITYFVVMFHPGGFFGSKRKINDPKILENTPVTAEVGRKPCLLTSAWDYSHSRFGTFFFFTCDMDEPEYSYTSYDRNINLYIDPKKFDKSYTQKNISLCSLAVMVSRDDCGTPDIPLHSVVTGNANKEWVYSCEEGYELVGSAKVICGRNGRWNGDFPTCKKRNLCPITRPPRSSILQVSYENLLKSNGKEIGIIDSLAHYSCYSLPNDKRILIGPSLRICTKTGEWSGSEPYCMDPNNLPKPSEQSSGSTAGIFGTVIGVIVAIALIIGLVYFVFTKGYLGVPKMRVPNLSIPKINIQRESTADVPQNISNGVENGVPIPPEPQLQKQKSTKVNENLPAFANGSELLIEPDIDD